LRRALIRTFILASLFLLAVAGGYLLSARVGTEALRVEVEKQLGQIFFGEVEVGACQLVIRGGLYLEGEDVWIYRWENDEFVGALHAPRAVAEIDPFALILGRFRLLYLMADGIEFHLEHRGEDLWSPAPLQWLSDKRARTRVEGDLENRLEFWRSVENVVRTLLTKPLAARKIEVRHGRVTFRDYMQLDTDGEPLELELVDVEGHLTHQWLSGNADMHVTTRLVRKADGTGGGEGPGEETAEGGGNERAEGGVSERADGGVSEKAEGGGTEQDEGYPVTIAGRQRSGDMRLHLDVEQVPAILLGYYVHPGGFDYRPRGGISGSSFFRTTALGQGRMVIDWQVDDFTARLPTHARPLPLETPVLQVLGEARLSDERFELVRMDFDAEHAGATVGGYIERPIRMTSHLNVEARVDTLELDELRTVAHSLPGGSADTFVDLFARVESGRIPEIVGRGNARLSRWDKLVDGRVSQLPEEFAVDLRLTDFTVATGDATRIDGLESKVSLAGDVFSANRTRAILDDSPLPTVDLKVRGISHLFRAAANDQSITTEAGNLPGLDALLGLFSSDDPSQPAGFPSTRLMIDTLEHPVLRWPVRDARVLIEGIENGLAIDFEEAIWAGSAVEGRATWLGSPDRSIAVDLRVIPPDPNESRTARTPDAVSGERPADPDVTTSVAGASSMQWASGRFELDRVEGSFLPMIGVRGHFALQGNELLVSKLRADLEPRGKLIADASLSLREPEEVPVQLNFSIVSADLERFAYGVGLPDKSAEGTIHLSGALDGPMRPQTPLLALLSGEVSLDARNGEIYRRLPLIVALAQASEGLRSIEERNTSITYEFMKAELQLDRGRVTTSDFRVEGPIRLYAQGRLDPLRPVQDNELVIAVFLFRQANALLEGLPVVRMLLPGSQRGLFGAYFVVTGDVGDPEVRPLTGRSIAEDLPDAVTAPFKVIQQLLGTPNEQVVPTP